MKKIYGFLLLALIVINTGCKQDPPVLPANLRNTQLLGKWNLAFMQSEKYIDGDKEPDSSPLIGTANDYFIFEADNRATLSSTVYQKLFQGYYSANTAASTLAFKSGDLLIRYNVTALSITQMELVETINTNEAGSSVTIINYYTYNRLP
ncbi:hypothetical protein [Mucilaginibacter aquatilis]|uniref:Lipocalin-like domain-containing protein n=1 Tax=Mucilaginibacter aquatilis TaxID=1517760 RepID=A0A6I4IC39_9SPHI|nr:hypothetical protein [Mucilaginibacter aquatilis]MVN92840.1 hypothetical protein [Mucilaginibacter aquatilis]